jgi:uncharacterized protein YbaR (Trm112 family)
MAKAGLLGAAVGLAAVVGGSVWAAKRLFGSGDGEPAYSDGGLNGGENAAEAPRREGLDPTLLEILACPDCKQPVIYQQEGEAERLTCTSCGKRYPVRDGIPVMLIDEAEAGPVPTEAEIAAARALAPQGKPAIVGAGPGGAAGAGSAEGPGSAEAARPQETFSDAATATRETTSGAGG